MKDIHAPIMQLSGESLFDLAKCNEKQDIVFSFLNNSDFKDHYDIECFIKNIVDMQKKYILEKEELLKIACKGVAGKTRVHNEDNDFIVENKSHVDNIILGNDCEILIKNGVSRRTYVKSSNNIINNFLLSRSSYSYNDFFNSHELSFKDEIYLSGDNNICILSDPAFIISVSGKNNLIILLSNSIYPVGTKKAHIMSCGDKTKIINFAEMVNINLTGNSNDIINFGSNCEISTSGNYDIIGSYGFNNGNIYSITGEKVFCSLNAVDECIFNNKNDYRNFPKNTLHFKGNKSNKIFTMFCKLDFGENDLLKWNYINNENKFVEDDNVCFFRK